MLEQLLFTVAIAYLLIRIWQWIFRKAPVPTRSRLGMAALLALLTAATVTVLGATEGELIFAAAATAYMLPTVLAALIEWTRLHLLRSTVQA